MDSTSEDIKWKYGDKVIVDGGRGIVLKSFPKTKLVNVVMLEGGLKMVPASAVEGEKK
jgi:energy-converting hydrogenase Eha subunit C